MSIATPRYALPPPALLPRTNRVLAILRQEFLRRLRALNLVFLSLIYIVVLLPLILAFYLRSLFQVGFSQSLLSTFFMPYGLGVWYIFLTLLASTVGAAIVAGDFSTRAITLYLSRPITRLDYLTAKAGALGLWLFLATVVPGAIGASMVLALGYVGSSVGLTAIGGFVGVGLLSTIAFSGLALALSALASRPMIAGAGIFGVLAGSEVLAGVFTAASGNSAFLYLSPTDLATAAAQGAFQVPGDAIDPWISSALLVAIGIAGILVAYVRLGREEVIRE